MPPGIAEQIEKTGQQLDDETYDGADGGSQSVEKAFHLHCIPPRHAAGS